MAADKLMWKTTALLFAATRLALWAWLWMEPRLLARHEDEVTRLRRLGAM